MRQGVRDSDVFLLMLSNSVLSRNFCRKEIMWALEFGKPIIILQMCDDRFWPWDYQRWKQDRCTKVPNTSPTQWEAGRLQSQYMVCERQIKQLISHHYRKRRMIAFRRRDFEANAMVHEVLSRAGESRLWGQSLPPSSARRDARVSALRVVFVVYEPASGSAIGSELQRSLSRESPAIRISTTANADQPMDQLLAGSSHVLVVLTRGAGAPGSVSLRQLQTAVRSQKPLLFTYQERTEACPSGWSFQDNDAADEVKVLLGSHEAMVYRAHADAAYEHTGMVLEMLRRMQPAAMARSARLANHAAHGEQSNMWETAAPAATVPRRLPAPGRRKVALRTAATARPVADATATANPISTEMMIELGELRSPR